MNWYAFVVASLFVSIGFAVAEIRARAMFRAGFFHGVSFAFDIASVAVERHAPRVLRRFGARLRAGVVPACNAALRQHATECSKGEREGGGPPGPPAVGLP